MKALRRLLRVLRAMYPERDDRFIPYSKWDRHDLVVRTYKDHWQLNDKWVLRP